MKLTNFDHHHHQRLEKGTATHSSILARRIPWREEPGRLWGHTESEMIEAI